MRTQPYSQFGCACVCACENRHGLSLVVETRFALHGHKVYHPILSFRSGRHAQFGLGYPRQSPGAARDAQGRAEEDA